MRLLLAAVLLAHGIAHVVGFVVPWKIIVSPEVPYRTTILSVDVGPAGVRLIGIAWLAAAFLFAALAASVLRNGAWWYEEAFVLVAFSIALCLLGLPESRPGFLANLIVVALLMLSRFAGPYAHMHP